MIPPPNVTGILHMGHALNNTIQDILVRWRRMQGRNVVWMPGTDHAGIATQNVVERALQKEGKTREDLGREAFIERVWEWREEYGSTIISQLKRLGASCDWDREAVHHGRGTERRRGRGVLSSLRQGPDLPRQLHHQLVSRAATRRCRTRRASTRIPTASSTTSATPSRSARHDYVVVATTRPETMLGDTAVAVNPDDERYRHLAGRQGHPPYP